MRLRFTKMQSAGNDYVVLDAFRDPALAEPPREDIARALCDRRFGVGADGVITLAPAELPADVLMTITNADGSPGGMCGNGLRCAARIAVERAHVRADAFGRVVVSIAERTVPVTVFFDDAGRFEAASADMGPASFEHADAPFDPGAPGVSAGAGHDRLRRIEGVDVLPVSMGNPHAVVFTDEPQDLLFSLGPTLERHPAFPEGANAHFVRVHGPDEATVLSWERGVGHTPACGSGACAVLAAGRLLGRLADDVVVRAPGGALILRADPGSDHLFMTGPAEVVFEGELVADGSGAP